MKKLFVCILVLALLLCSCGTEPEYDRTMLEYPGLSWGMTVDQVLEAMNLSREEIAYENTDIPEEGVSQGHWEYLVLFQNVKLLGQRANAVFFTFRDYSRTGEGYVLTAVDACYSDGTEGAAADLDALAERLTELYGERSREYRFVTWDYSQGEPLVETTPYEEDEYVWDSERTAFDVMTTEQQETLYQIHLGSGRYKDQEDVPTREEERQMYDRPVCQITLFKCFDPFQSQMERELTEEQRELGLTNYRLTMSASGYYELLYLMEHMDEFAP